MFCLLLSLLMVNWSRVLGTTYGALFHVCVLTLLLIPMSCQHIPWETTDDDCGSESLLPMIGTWNKVPGCLLQCGPTSAFVGIWELISG